MPFKSKKQMKACFASDGFNGKVDCKEWARETKNTKSLPNKKEEGGYNMRKPKNCKKCGGKMQTGGSASKLASMILPPQGPQRQAYIDSLSQRRTQLADEYEFVHDSQIEDIQRQLAEDQARGSLYNRRYTDRHYYDQMARLDQRTKPILNDLSNTSELLRQSQNPITIYQPRDTVVKPKKQLGGT